MSSQTAIPIKASTQEHLAIEDIQDDIIILKDGACALVIQVTAINFGLLSESEQDAIIYAYAGMLNSLTFSIQIIIRSSIKDVSEYIRLIRKQEQKQKKPLLLEQLRRYRQFVESTVRENQVLDKKFYAVIPFTTLELGLVNTITSDFQKKKKLPYPKSYILEKAKMNLFPKRDHLFRQFSRLGLQCRQLNTQQLLELFYNFYNLESIGQKFTPSKDYQSPIVQTSINQQQTHSGTPSNPFTRAEPPTANTPTTPFPNSQTIKQSNLVGSKLGMTGVEPATINVSPSSTNHDQLNTQTIKPQQNQQFFASNNQAEQVLNQTQQVQSTEKPKKLNRSENQNYNQKQTIFQNSNPTKQDNVADQRFGYDQSTS